MEKDSKKYNSLKSLALLVVGLLLGWLIFGGSGGEEENTGHEGHNHSQEESVIWTCSMHPQIRQDEFGLCPICAMDLTPLEGDGEGVDPNEIAMSESALKLAEVQTYIVKKEAPEKVIHLLGKVKPDETLTYSQTAHIPGRIEKLYVDFTGEKVSKGQKLATIYSPELITAQKELFEIKNSSNVNSALLEAARKKLKLWKLTDKQIENLENSGELQTEIDILSDYSGYVATRKIALGDYIKEGQPLYSIVSLSKVWLMFEAYEKDIAWIKENDEIEIELKSFPGEIITANIDFIDPFLNPKTRVVNLRVSLDNPDAKIKPDMFANGIVKAVLPLDGPTLLLPKTAVLWTGKRSIVYVKNPYNEETSFALREVILGEDAGEYYVIKSGVEEGEEVASHGVFRIDAAAQLAGKPSMMNPGESSEATPLEPEFEASPELQTQIGEVVRNYLDLSTEMLAQNQDNIVDAADFVLMSLEDVDMDNLEEDAEMAIFEYVDLITMECQNIIESKSIDDQLIGFSKLSTNLSEMVKAFGVDIGEEPLYLDFCPMANNDEGAVWLSVKKEIENPYFGGIMLKCGEIKQKLN